MPRPSWTLVSAHLLMLVFASLRAQAEEPVSEPPHVVPPLSEARTVVLDFLDTDLASLAEYFARATDRRVLLGELRSLQSKRVTIVSNRPVSPGAAWHAFLSALEIHGLTIVEVEGLYKIIEADEAQRAPTPLLAEGGVAATDAYQTRVFALEQVSVGELRELVDRLVSPQAKVLAYQPTNSFIITDTGYNLLRLDALLADIDTAAPSSHLTIYPVVFASAAELAALIQELYGTVEASAKPLTRAQRRAQRRAARLDRIRARRRAQLGLDARDGITAGEASEYITTVLSDERTNSLIVLANDEGHEAVRQLLSELDVDTGLDARSEVHVVRLEHADAAEVATLLQDLRQAGGGGRGPQERSVGQRRASAARASQTRASADVDVASAASTFDADIRTVADETTNALVVIASRDDFEVLERVIRELDVRRRQVLVDAVVLELSRTDGHELGLAAHGTPPIPGASAVASGQLGASSLGVGLDDLSGFDLGVYGSTLEVPTADSTGTGTVTIPAFGVALQALTRLQTVDIVSMPSLMVLDNEEATLTVGRKIPFPQSNGLNSLGQPVRTFNREDVALELSLTPRIGSADIVTLELSLEVEEVEQGEQFQVAQAGPVTSRREIESTVSLGDNQTAVLGGLIASTSTTSEAKLPILGDVPVLGSLFRTRSIDRRQTELVVFLTPHIVDDEQDVAEIMRVQEAQRREFQRRFLGRSRDEQLAEIRRLMQYSMNLVDQPSVFRGPTTVAATVTVDGEPISHAAREDLGRAMAEAPEEPGTGAGELPDDEVDVETER